MAEQKIRISQLQQSTNINGLVVLGTDSQGNSVKVPFDTVLETQLARYVRKGYGRVYAEDANVVVLETISGSYNTTQNTSNAGLAWYTGSGSTIRVIGFDGISKNVAIDTKRIYYDKNTKKLYRWNASNTQFVAISGESEGQAQAQADWGQTDQMAVDYIKNKPVKEYATKTLLEQDEPTVETIGYIIGDDETSVYFWDGTYWNYLPSLEVVCSQIDDALTRRIHLLQTNAVVRPMGGITVTNIDCKKAYLIPSTVTTISLQISGDTDNAMLCECVVYIDCTQASKTVAWSNVIWVGDAPAMEQGYIYEVSVCRVCGKWLGSFVAYECNVAFDTSLITQNSSEIDI